MSEFLWMRKWRILIADAQDNKVLDVSDLRVTFNVRRAQEINNFAEISIYNLNNQTEQLIIKEGDRVIIEAGYEGYLTTSEEGEVTTAKDKDGKPAEKQYGKIFDGQVIFPSRRKENNTDYILHLLCVDGANALNMNFVLKTLNKGLNQRQILQAACDEGIVKIPTNNITQGLSEQRLPRGRVLFGEPRDIISDVARGNAANYWVEDGQLNLEKISDDAKAEAIVVTPTTGLIGMPTQTQYGASFRLLLNPSVRMKTLVQLKNSEINEVQAKPGDVATPLDDEWIYQVIEVVHHGDTRGQDWYTDCTAVSRYGKGSLAALMTNAAQNPNGV